MSKDELIAAVTNSDDSDEVRALIEEFVAEWIEHLTDSTIDGYSAQAVVDQWHAEMGS